MFLTKLQKGCLLNSFSILVLSVSLGLFCISCATTPTLVSPPSRTLIDLHVIQMGMSSQEVKDLLRNKVVIGYEIQRDKTSEIKPINLKNPYRIEIFRTEGKIFEIVYYLAEIKKQDGALNNDELIPLVFENDRLIGEGWFFLEKIKKENHLNSSTEKSA